MVAIRREKSTDKKLAETSLVQDGTVVPLNRCSHLETLTNAELKEDARQAYLAAEKHHLEYEESLKKLERNTSITQTVDHIYNQVNWNG